VEYKSPTSLYRKSIPFENLSKEGSGGLLRKAIRKIRIYEPNPSISSGTPVKVLICGRVREFQKAQKLRGQHLVRSTRSGPCSTVSRNGWKKERNTAGKRRRCEKRKGRPGDLKRNVTFSCGLTESGKSSTKPPPQDWDQKRKKGMAGTEEIIS